MNISQVGWQLSLNRPNNLCNLVALRMNMRKTVAFRRQQLNLITLQLLALNGNPSQKWCPRQPRQFQPTTIPATVE